MKSKTYKILTKSHLIRWLFSIIGLESPGIKQLLKELKFTIGEQYENYEFDLEEQGSKTINGLTYEIYLYDKDNFQTLFGLPIKTILLYFNADILSCVEYRFEGNQFDDLLDKIDGFIPGITQKYDPQKDFIFTLKDSILVEFQVIDSITTHLFLYADYFKKGTQKGIHSEIKRYHK